MRFRLLFGILGALACLLAAMLAEPIFGVLSARRVVDDHVTHVLIYRSDIGRRLERAGAARGDVEVALDWNNRNDLDLHVVDPYGFEIYFARPLSKEGGRLDVDANSVPGPDGRYTTTPVEHIVWPYGHAPTGRYVVSVNYYHNHGDPDRTPFHVEVRAQGRVHEYNGIVNVPTESKTICEFNVGHGDRQLTGYLTALLRAVAITGLWIALLGTFISGALVCGQQWLYRKRYHAPLIPSRRIPVVIWQSAAAGLVAGAFGQLLYSLLQVDPGPFPEVLAPWLGWALLGAILGAGLARIVPNLPSRAALIAGAVGGSLGCYCFLSTMNGGSDAVGRASAAACLGLLIGLMVGLVLEPEEEIEAIETIEVLVRPMSLRPNRARAAGVIRPPDRF